MGTRGRQDKRWGFGAGKTTTELVDAGEFCRAGEYHKKHGGGFCGIKVTKESPLQAVGYASFGHYFTNRGRCKQWGIKPAICE
jgi:hypothetical protein